MRLATCAPSCRRRVWSCGRRGAHALPASQIRPRAARRGARAQQRCVRPPRTGGTGPGAREVGLYARIPGSQHREPACRRRRLVTSVRPLTSRAHSDALPRARLDEPLCADCARLFRGVEANACYEIRGQSQARAPVERSHLRRRRTGFCRHRTSWGGLGMHAASVAGASAAARATAGAARGDTAHPPRPVLARLRALTAHARGILFNMLMERSVHLATCRRSSRSTCTASLSSRRGSGVSHVSNVHRRAPGRPEPFVRRLPWPAAWRCAASFFAPPTACHVCHVRRVDGVWATRPPLCRRPKSTVS